MLVPAGSAAAANVPLFVVPSVAALRRLMPAETSAAASQRQAVPGPAVATERVLAAAAVLAAVGWPAANSAGDRASAAAALPAVSGARPSAAAATCRPGTSLQPGLLSATAPQRALLRSPSSSAAAAAHAAPDVRDGVATVGPTGSSTRSGSGQAASPAPAAASAALVAASSLLPSGTDRSPETRPPPAKRRRVTAAWDASSSPALASGVAPDDRGRATPAVVAARPSAQARHGRARRSLAAAAELSGTALMTGGPLGHDRGVGGGRFRHAACQRDPWSTAYGQGSAPTALAPVVPASSISGAAG